MMRASQRANYFWAEALGQTLLSQLRFVKLARVRFLRSCSEESNYVLPYALELGLERLLRFRVGDLSAHPIAGACLTLC